MALDQLAEVAALLARRAGGATDVSFVLGDLPLQLFKRLVEFQLERKTHRGL